MRFNSNAEYNSWLKGEQKKKKDLEAKAAEEEVAKAAEAAKNK